MTAAHLDRWARMPADRRRLVAAKLAARLVCQHRKACGVLAGWYDADLAGPAATDAAEILVFAAVRRQMRAAGYLIRRFRLTAADLSFAAAII